MRGQHFAYQGDVSRCDKARQSCWRKAALSSTARASTSSVVVPCNHFHKLPPIGRRGQLVSPHASGRAQAMVAENTDGAPARTEGGPGAFWPMRLRASLRTEKSMSVLRSMSTKQAVCGSTMRESLHRTHEPLASSEQEALRRAAAV